MIYGKLVQIERYQQIFHIRKYVIYEETGKMLDTVIDDKDQEAFHAVVLESMNSEEIVGCGRIYLDGDTAIIDRIAVLKNYRNKGYGDFILRMLINKGLNTGVKKILVYGQKNHISWYNKVGLELDENYEVKIEDGLSIIRMYLANNTLKKPCSN